LKIETRVIIIGAIFTTLLVAGAVFLLSRGEQVNVPEDQIISRTGIHWHPRITILIKGEKQEIPADFGVGAVHSPIHTHAADSKEGILHLEMSGLVTKDETKLSKWFQLWGKEFNSNRLFDKTNGSDGTVKMFVNGQENTEFENYLMEDGDKIEVRYE
jgi:hypothetical protein